MKRGEMQKKFFRFLDRLPYFRSERESKNQNFAKVYAIFLLKKLLYL